MTAIESSPPTSDDAARLRISIVGIKLLSSYIIGDGGSGKTVLLIAYTKRAAEFPEEYIPTGTHLSTHTLL